MSTTPPPRARRRGSPRTVLIRLVALAVAGSALVILGPPAQAATETSAADKIRPQLSQQLDQKDEASFWVRFEQADLEKAAAVKDWADRGQAVYDALTAAAAASQKDSIELLDAEGATYQTFYATNAIRVDAGDEALVEKLAGLGEVQSLWPTRDYAVEKPVKGEDVKQVDAVEWGVANINADDVWDEFGTTGEGIVVGNIDTGVQFDHPALASKYRGNNGDGTFDHNYNWFDAAGTCATAPCDTNGHGSHTMGTMVGDDGGANQIGVAPGATWIAANGCCPSDGALIASGEWMLAPTDLDGENADVTKRPHIVNNSWGTQVPSNDPFMEDVLEAWAAAGIFGTWSNGNNGPSCQTSGSPGSRTLNYSVGAYDVSNNIAGFSSRGAGQDGELKPNISAPGVNVRSSLPGNSYGSYNGTSMAAPHLAGSIALLWSAAPGLVGDIDATRALLDGSATDSDSTACGGTADDNNVFGEGRLDALALLNAAPVGDTGEVAGTVTDEETGDPIEGAEVELTGEISRTLTTAADGTYSAQLTAGDYTADVSAYGYGSETASITVVTGETVTQDFALTASPMVTLSGSVNDGSGHDWPLYAEVAVDGAAPDTYTDPTTGEYSLTLPAGTTYSVTVTSQYPGYLSETREVTLADGDATEEFELLVDSATCTAAGYAFNSSDATTEDFNGGELPAGWTIEDNVGNDQVWRFDDPDSRGNLTGGDGAFAISDSDFWGSGEEQDTSLISPVMDMSSLTAPVVGFKQDYNNLGDTADVDVSIDGGTTWENVLNQTTDVRGPREDIIPLPMAAGEPDVQVRFHHYNASYDWWWQVDDFFAGNRTCDPVRGGLVLGHVRGASGRAGINGATVTSLDRPAEKAVSAATPDDPGLDDGFYWMFSSLTGQHPFEAKANQYGSQTKQVSVAADWATEANYRLAAGHLTVTPTSLQTTSTLGGTAKSRTFEVTNDGNAPVDVEFSESPGGFVMQAPDGSRVDGDRVAEQEGAPLQEIRADVSFAATATGMGGTGSPAPYEAPTRLRGPTSPTTPPRSWTTASCTSTGWPTRSPVVTAVPRPRRCTPTTRPPWRGRRRQACPMPATPWRWERSTDRSSRPVVGPQPGPARTPGSSTRRVTPGRRRPMRRCRWRLPDRPWPTESCTSSVVAPPRPARRCRTTSLPMTPAPTRGSSSPTTRQPWPSRRAAASTGRCTAPAETAVRVGPRTATSTTPAPTRGTRSPRTPRSTRGRPATPWPTASSWSTVGSRAGSSPTGRSPTTPRPRRGWTCPTPTPLATAAGWPVASPRSVVRPVGSPRPSTARRCQGSRTAAPAPRTSNG